jgi:hypothetical protein
MEDNEFAWNYCPECGDNIRWDGTFVMAGRYGRYVKCGKKWHVIWDNADEFSKDEEDDGESLPTPAI